MLDFGGVVVPSNRSCFSHGFHNFFWWMKFFDKNLVRCFFLPYCQGILVCCFNFFFGCLGVGGEIGKFKKKQSKHLNTCGKNLQTKIIPKVAQVLLVFSS